MKKALAALAATLALCSVSFADDSTGPLDGSRVRHVLKAQGLNDEAITQLINALNQGPGAEAKKEMTLSTMLFSHGFNGAFFVDNDNWNLDAVINYKGQTVAVDDLFDVYYHNGGLKLEIAYKWFWVFVPSYTSIDSLDGAVFGGPIFGRGIALSTNFVSGSPLAIEGGWVARQDGPGHAFIVAVKAGLVGGSLVATKEVKDGGNSKRLTRVALPEISFPKLQFSQKKIIR